MPKTSSRLVLFPKVRRVSQRTIAHCGPAVLEMLLSHLEITVHQDAFIDAAKVAHKLEKEGMSVPDMAAAVKKSVPQATFWYKRGASIENVHTILHYYQYPVGVEWQGMFGKHADEDNGHYSVIIAIKPGRDLIQILDPFWKFAGKIRRIKLSTFVGRWWDTNLIENPKTHKRRRVRDEHMIFIITPKKMTFPKILGMQKG